MSTQITKPDEGGEVEGGEPATFADGTPVQPLPGTDESGSDQDQPADGRGAGEAATSEEVGLLSNEEFERLKGDPSALRTRLNELHQEALKPYSGRDMDLQFVDRLRSDPVGTLRALVERAKTSGYDTSSLTGQQQTDQGATPASELVEAIGEEAANLAVPAIQKMIDKAVREAVGPITQSMSTQEGHLALQRANDAVTAIKKRHPDLPKYEKRMEQLARQITPGEGITEADWLEHLYVLASANGRSGDVTRDTVTRINNSVRQADRPARSAHPSQVQETGGSRKDDRSFDQKFDEAFQMALQGKRRE